MRSLLHRASDVARLTVAVSASLTLAACSGAGDPKDSTGADAATTTEGTDTSASGLRATPCPDVPAPGTARVSACEEKGGKLVGQETDGCVRGYECVLP